LPTEKKVAEPHPSLSLSECHSGLSQVPEGQRKLAGGEATEGSGNHRIACQKRTRPGRGREEQTGFVSRLRPHPFRHSLPGCLSLFAMIRWFSLALLASPPANLTSSISASLRFHDASGVAKRMTRPVTRMAACAV